MVIEWSPQEDAIILKHAKDKQYKTKAVAFAAASQDILITLGIDRTVGAVGQRWSKANLREKGKHPNPSREITITKNNQVQAISMAYNVAVMAIQRLQPHERLALVEKMLNSEL